MVIHNDTLKSGSYYFMQHFGCYLQYRLVYTRNIIMIYHTIWFIFSNWDFIPNPIPIKSSVATIVILSNLLLLPICFNYFCCHSLTSSISIIHILIFRLNIFHNLFYFIMFVPLYVHIYSSVLYKLCHTC